MHAANPSGQNAARTIAEPTPSQRNRPLDGWAAMLGGIAVGGALLLFPQGEPWAALTSFSPAVMGRAVPVSGWNSPAAAALHLLLSLGDALLIAVMVRQPRNWRGVLLGGAVGLGLYGLNVLVVRAGAPEFLGAETRVAVTHVLFGLFAAAVYKGLARRPASDSPQPAPAAAG